jgi:hypothetical protein
MKIAHIENVILSVQLPGLTCLNHSIPMWIPQTQCNLQFFLCDDDVVFDKCRVGGLHLPVVPLGNISKGLVSVLVLAKIIN